MKRRELERHLQANVCSLLQEGAAHSIWVNPQTSHREAVPRHNEIKKHLARKFVAPYPLKIRRARDPFLEFTAHETPHRTSLV